MATLKDIASRAGVSITTVSNVINGNYGKVSKENIERINAIIEEINYVPNLTARTLSAKSSKIIGVIVPYYDSNNNLFKDPYISELFGHIQYFLNKCGYYVMIRPVKNLLDITTLLKNWNMDGAIFLMPDYDKIVYSILKENKLPMVFLDSYSELPNILTVGINDFKGGYISTKYLINQGHRKILFAGPLSIDNEIIMQRLRGYKAALEESNIPVDESLLINVSPVYDEGIILGNRISNKEFDITSVVTTADILAVGIIEGAKKNGLRIPADISIIGFDDLAPSLYVTPKLTTIAQDIKEKAKGAVDLLMEYIENNSVTERKIVLDVSLVERQSVASI